MTQMPPTAIARQFAGYKFRAGVSKTLLPLIQQGVIWFQVCQDTGELQDAEPGPSFPWEGQRYYPGEWDLVRAIENNLEYVWVEFV